MFNNFIKTKSYGINLIISEKIMLVKFKTKISIITYFKTIIKRNILIGSVISIDFCDFLIFTLNLWFSFLINFKY